MVNWVLRQLEHGLGLPWQRINRMLGAPRLAELPLPQRNTVPDGIDRHQARGRHQPNRDRLARPARGEYEVREATSDGKKHHFDVGPRASQS
jgi:hypothetical protein